jgi:hypothetical protein
MSISTCTNDFASWSRFDQVQLKTQFLLGEEIDKLSCLYKRHSNKIRDELLRQGLIDNFVSPHIRFEKHQTRSVTRKDKETIYYEEDDGSDSDYVPSRTSSDTETDDSDYFDSEGDSDDDIDESSTLSNFTRTNLIIRRKPLKDFIVDETDEESDEESIGSVSEYVPSEHSEESDDEDETSSEVSEEESVASCETDNDTEIPENKIIHREYDFYDLKRQFELIHASISHFISIFEHLFIYEG